MKNLILLIGLCIAMVSCSYNGNGNTTDTKHSTGRLDVSIVTLTVDGLSHEYLQVPYSITHYPECKYCKKKHDDMHPDENSLVCLTSDGVTIYIYYTGQEVSIEKKNNIRKYFHNCSISEVNTEEFEDNFYQAFKLENCKFDYNIK